MVVALLAACVDGPPTGIDAPDSGDAVAERPTASVEVPAEWPDLDEDADGFVGSIDCDDTDETRYPGSAEVRCDGVDQDCDGTDARDCDGDGGLANADGGDDCNDGNPYVYAGAPEMCDAADQNCDGQGWEPGVCGIDQQPGGMGVKLTGVAASPAPKIVRDVTGDGVSDILHIETQSGLPAPGFGYWTATEISDDAGDFPVENNQAAFYSVTSARDVPLDYGDVDGDGFNDIGYVASEGASMIAGPIPTGGAWPSDGRWIGRWYAGYYGCWGCGVAAGDYNGDGLGDLAASVYGSRWYTGAGEWGDGGLFVFWGGDFTGNYTQLGDSYTSSLWDVGDLTGDGIDDIVVDDPEGAEGGYLSAWVDGTDIAAAPMTGWFIRDIHLAGFLHDGDGEEVHGWFNLGDLDGDGAVELVTGYSSGRGDEERENLIFSATLRGDISGSDAAGGWRTYEEFGSYPFAWVKRCEETIVTRETNVAYAFEHPTGIPPRGSDLPAQRLTVLAGDDRGFVPDCGDVTGDGLEDLVFGFPDYADDDDYSDIRVISDWAIPWDDETMW